MKNQALFSLKDKSKKFVADNTNLFYFYLSKKVRLDVSCESSAKQGIHMNYQALFYQKKQCKNGQDCCLLQFLFGAVMVYLDTLIS